MNNAGQHGRQPTPQAAPPSDPRIRNIPANPPGPVTTATSVTESSGICRDFIWGICAMGEKCIYRHDLDFEAMKETLKFCHDHQNRTGCTRPDCTYLHTSRDEENIFLTTGQIPRVLLDRYASMSYSECRPAATEASHMAVYEYIAHPPPPPPPPPAQPGAMLHSPLQTQQQQMQATLMISPIQGHIHGTMNGGIQGPMQGPMPCPMPSPMQGPMPSAMQGPMPSAMQGPMPSAMQGPMPSAMQGPMPSAMQGPMPSAMQGPMPCPMPGPMQSPMPCPMPGPIQGPMPCPMSQMHIPMQTGSAPLPQMPAPMQPPPPPPPPTSSVSSSRMSGPAYTGGHHASTNFGSAHYQPTNNQQTVLPIFDPTRPPPPIPQRFPTKRPSDGCEAGPSKLRRSETSNERSCEKCVQRRLRLELYARQTIDIKKDIDKAQMEVTAKHHEFDQKKRLIQSIVGPQVYGLVEDFVERGKAVPSTPSINSSWSDVFSMQSPLTQTNSNTSSESALINSLLGMIVKRDVEPVSVTSDDDLLQQLSSRLRPTKAKDSTDFLSTLLDLVQKSPTERNTSAVSRSSSVSVGHGSVRSFSEAGPSTTLSYEVVGPSPSRLYEGTGPSPSRLYDGTGPSTSRPYESAGPTPSRPYDGLGPTPSRPYDGVGPAPSRPYDGVGPTPSRPYDGVGPTPSRPYDGVGPMPSRPYDGAVASTGYTQMPMAPYEPVRYQPPAPASTAPTNGQYHPGMDLMAMSQGARPASSPIMQISGPGPYGSQQTHMQAPGPSARPPFYVQTPPYNGANPSYPGMMPQAGRPPMQPPQNPPTNFYFGNRFPNYYPPYQ